METKTSCKSPTGITVGIIDTIINQCRLLKGRNLKVKSVREAIKDLLSDEDYRNLVGNLYREGFNKGIETSAKEATLDVYYERDKGYQSYELKNQKEDDWDSAYASPCLAGGRIIFIDTKALLELKMK